MTAQATPDQPADAYAAEQAARAAEREWKDDDTCDTVGCHRIAGHWQRCND